MQQIAAGCDVILLSLPDGKAVAAVVGQLEPHLRAGQCVVDTGTSQVELTWRIGAQLATKDILYADAPVARTRDAASRGELSIMVGATPETFGRIKREYSGDNGNRRHALRSRRMRPSGQNPQQHVGVPTLRRIGGGDCHWASQWGACRRAATDDSNGSGDSFVLRNHGVKAMLPDIFPERAFSVRYAMKDLSYALEMAAASGLDVAAAELTMARLKRTVRSGYGEQYHPVVLKIIDPQ